MLKKTLIAAVAVSLMAFGATVADAKSGGGGGGGGGGHGGGGGGGGHGGGGGGHGGGHHGGGHHKFHTYNNFWWGYAYSPSCHYETRKVRIKVRDRWGKTHRRWVWRDVRVCN
jgi:hypothetical protein